MPGAARRSEVTLMFVSGDVIRPGDLKCVPNEGMPVYRSPFQKGKLILQFQVRSQSQAGAGVPHCCGPCVSILCLHLPSPVTGEVPRAWLAPH